MTNRITLSNRRLGSQKITRRTSGTALREAIDANRVVFSNQKGLYPFELLKTTYQLLREFDPSTTRSDPQMLGALRSTIVLFWRRLQDQLRNERPATIESEEFEQTIKTALKDEKCKGIRTVLERINDDCAKIVQNQ